MASLSQDTSSLVEHIEYLGLHRCELPALGIDSAYLGLHRPVYELLALGIDSAYLGLHRPVCELLAFGMIGFPTTFD
jgi:hypothetical protein